MAARRFIRVRAVPVPSGRVGLGGDRCEPQLDVNRDHPVGSGEEGVEVELGDLGQGFGEATQPQEQLLHGLRVHRRPAPVFGQ
jgi:hypothetical protein